MNKPFIHDHSRQLSCITPDQNGEFPDLSIVGKTYVHTPSGKSFLVKDYTFLGDSDEWAYLLEEFPGACLMSRSLRGFNGKKGESLLKRFMQRQDIKSTLAES